MERLIRCWNLDPFAGTMGCGSTLMAPTAHCAANAAGTPADLVALKHADSVSVDPHKWLYAPLEAGCALVRKPDELLNTFSYHPSYYHFEEEATNYFDLGMQNSRGFRALKVWTGPSASGTRRLPEDDRRRYPFGEASSFSRVVASRVGGTLVRTQHHDVPIRSAGSRVSISGPLKPKNIGIGLNKEILSRIELSGEAFLSNADR